MTQHWPQHYAGVMPFLIREPDTKVRVMYVLDKYDDDALMGAFPANSHRAPIAFVERLLGVEWIAVGAGAHPNAPGKAPTIKNLRENKPFIKSLIDKYQPEVVVALGKSALLSLEDYVKMPSQFKWDKVVNKVIKLDTLPFVVVPSAGLGTFVKDYLNLYTLVENVSAALKPAVPPVESEYFLVDDVDTLTRLIREFPRGETYVGLDTETTGLNFLTEKLLTVQFSWKEHWGFTVRFDLIPVADWNRIFKTLRKRGARFVLQNGKFDYKFLRRNGVRLPDWDELSVAHAILDERPGTHNLEFISQLLLGEGKYSYSVEDFVSGNVSAFSEYAARDADLTRRAFLKLQEAGATSTRSYRIMSRAARTLADAEYRGWAIDALLLDELIGRAEAGLAHLDTFFAALELNPLSTPQVKAYLDTDDAKKETLKGLDSEVANQIIEYKGLRKVLRGYLLRIKANSAVDGRFHADYRLTGTVTGRLSAGSGSPKTEEDRWLPINIQNIPRPEEDGVEYVGLADELRNQLRNVFVASEGYELVGTDLAAAEMRMAGSLSKDPVLIDDMNNKVDIHAINTVTAFRLPIEASVVENPEQLAEAIKPYKGLRTATKRGTFASLYGGSAGKISASLGIDILEGESILRALYTRYPGLKKWFNNVHGQVKKDGQVTSVWGRVRHFPYSTGVFSNKTKSAMLREAQNWLIQLTASEYLLDRMGQFDAQHQDKGWFTLANVHDAAYIEVPVGQGEQALAELVSTLQRPDEQLQAVMWADGHKGQRWGEL